ncbi:Ig-like domain-containing protein, partial [Chloroflexota bacterium]
MMYRNSIALLLFLALLPVISACAAGTAGQPEKPTANITSPANGQHVFVGQEVVVKFGASDVQGVAQMELTINGEPVYIETLNTPVNAFVADYTWIPDRSGSFVIQAIAFSVAGDSSEPVQVVVTVDEATGDNTPTFTPEPTIQATNTPTPSPTSTSQPASTS